MHLANLLAVNTAKETASTLAVSTKGSVAQRGPGYARSTCDVCQKITAAAKVAAEVIIFSDAIVTTLASATCVASDQRR